MVTIIGHLRTVWKTENYVTTVSFPAPDTLSNTAAIPQPLGETKMFSRNTFESNLTAIIAVVLAVAFVASLVA